MNPIKFKNQEEEYAAYIDLIKRRDGLMVRQMYQFIEPDETNYKIKYDTFCLHLKKALKGKGARLFHPIKKSRSQFYSFRSHLTQNRQFLMVMLAEWELLNKKEAPWFYREMDISKRYEFMSQHLELLGDRLTFKKAGAWHKNLANDTKNRNTEKEMQEAEKAFQEDEKRKREITDALNAARKAIEVEKTKVAIPLEKAKGCVDGFDYGDLRKSYKPQTSPQNETLKRPEPMKAPALAPYIPKPKPIKATVPEPEEEVKPVKKKVDGDRPAVPLRSLYLRGIFIEPKIDVETGFIDHWVFHWFDNNNLYDYKFQENYAMIVEWLISMDYCPSWEIVIYSWTEVRKRVYQRSLKPQMSKLKARFSAANVVKILNEIHPRFKGMSFVALNCDKYFGLTTRTTKDWKKAEDEAKAASIKEERMKAVEAIRATPKPRKKREKGPVKVRVPSMKTMMARKMKELKEKKNLPIDDLIFDPTTGEIIFDLSK